MLTTLSALRFDMRPTLVITLLLALVLRVTSLGRESLWLDEAISYLAATLPTKAIWGNYVVSSHPPFYYLTLHFWLKLGLPGDAFLRLPDVFWSLILIPIVYQLGYQLTSSRSLALTAAFLVAISPFHIFYSHELRMYTLLMLLTSLLILAYVKARQTMAWSWWIIFGVSSFFAIYTHLFAFTVLAAVGIHALLYRHDREALRRTILMGMILLVLFIPWIVVLMGESQYELGSLRPLAHSEPRESSILKPLNTVNFLLFGYSTTVWYVGLGLFLVLSQTLIIAMEYRRRQSNAMHDPMFTLPVLIIACAIGLPIVAYSVRTFYLPARAMSAAAPFLALLLAWATTRRRSPLPYLVAGSALLMVVGTILYHTSVAQKPPYRAMSNFLQEQRQHRDAVLHTSDGSYLPALRYAQFENQGLLQGDPDPRKPRAVYEMFGGEVWTREEAIHKGSRLWVVVAREHSVPWQEQQLAYFEANFDRLAAHDVGGITINLYSIDEGKE